MIEIERIVRCIQIMRDSGLIKDALQNMYYLVDSETKEPISKEYYDIKDLGNNNYAVCTPAVVASGDIEYQYKIIRMVKCDDKEYKEIDLAPAVYNNVYPNNENTATVYASTGLTYVDLNGHYFAEQLTPAVLEHACSFGVPYKGFAECSVEGRTGYLYREWLPLEEIHPWNLLTEEQVKRIIESKKETPKKLVNMPK